MNAAVGVDRRAVLACHEHAVVEAVGKRFDEIVLTDALADADVAGENAEHEKHAEHGEQREQRQQQRLGCVAGDEREHDRTGGDGAQEDGDKPALAETTAEGVMAPQGGLGLAEIAFAHEGESYLILGRCRVGRLHGYSVLYATLLDCLGTALLDISGACAARDSLARERHAPGCTSRHPQFDH